MHAYSPAESNHCVDSDCRCGPRFRPGRVRTHGSDGSLKQLEQTFKAEAIASPSHMSSHRLQDFPNDTFMLAVREADGVVEWHENLPDVFIVESGSAALIVGGKMVGGERADHMKNATARSKVAPG